MAKRLLTPEIKDGILQAFEQVGGVEYLVELARVDPPTFCRLLAAIIPSEIKADVLPNLSSFISKACSGYGPVWTGLQTHSA